MIVCLSKKLFEKSRGYENFGFYYGIVFWSIVLYDRRKGNEVFLMEKQVFCCQKCGYHEFVEDQFQATGGTMAKLFDVQNKKFITISCKRCGYTELYRAETSSGSNILDFLIGG